MSIGSNDSNDALSARRAGVRVAQEGPRSKGEAMKLLNLAPVEWVLAEYYDRNGDLQRGLFLKLGENYYAAKDTEAWCRQLFPMNDWLKTQVDNRVLSTQPVQVPADDSVSVMDP